MKNQKSQIKGFSLIEIMVTVAILSILAGSTFVGFGSFSQTIQVQQAARSIGDIIGEMQFELSRDEYEAQVIHFEKNFLVIEAEHHPQTLNLNWLGIGGSCLPTEEELEIDNSTFIQPVQLVHRSRHDVILSTENFAPGVTVTRCIDFASSDELEWRYQLLQGSAQSQTIRFRHFNAKKDDDPQQVQITEGNDYTMKLTDIVVKSFYDNGVKTSNTVQLKLEYGDSETNLVLQK